MKLDQLLELDRSAVRKHSKRTMGLSVPHNRHAKGQQSKAARQYNIDDQYGDDDRGAPSMSDAPYAVIWFGHEMETIIGFNIPTYEMATKIAQRYEDANSEGDSWNDSHGGGNVMISPHDEFVKDHADMDYMYTKDTVDYGSNEE